jgi:DNA-binding Lrp family transcriptional regulator
MSKTSAKSKILNYLDKHGEGTVARIADKTGLDTLTVAKRVHDLRNEGHRIVSETYRYGGRNLTRYVSL